MKVSKRLKTFYDAVWMDELRCGTKNLKARAGANLQPSSSAEQQMKRQKSPDTTLAEANKRVPAPPLAAERLEDASEPSAREVAAAEAARARLYGSGDTQVCCAGN